MPVATRKGAAGMADLLAGRIVRSRGRCQYPDCTSSDVVWAHILVRNNSGTRCLEDNAWALCGTHHALVDNFPDEKMGLVRLTIGEPRYYELRAIAAAYKHQPISATTFWRDEVERLKARCIELGLSPKRSAA